MSLWSRLERIIGGRARTEAVLLFACALGLESADLATVGAAAPELESAFHISNFQLGLLAAISTVVGAVATVPVGALTDRVRRVPLLTGAVALWAVAMAASAAAPDYAWLLVCRLGLGAVTAAAGPTVASLSGDFFPPSERGRIYGYILSGELIGAAVGFVISGTVAQVLSWRWAFALLVVPAAALAAVIHRRLREPQRGAQTGVGASGRPVGGVARKAIASSRIEPISDHVLRSDARSMPLRKAARYVLSIRTNLWLICASAIGYFFFAGLRTFALVFVQGRLSISQSGATGVLFLGGLGALTGVLVSGRLADRLIRRGKLTARIGTGAAGYLLAAVFLVPVVLAHSAILVVPPLILAGASLAAPNPPLDAARLDVMPSRLWGRAEGVRTLLRQSAQAAAPLLFGLIADRLGGRGASISAQHVSSAATRGLQYTFLIMLIPLAVNGLMLLRAQRSYAADVATAIASERARQPERGQARKRRRGQRGATSATFG